MAGNALAPKPLNAFVQPLLRETAAYPQYGEIADYLMARRKMPTVEAAILPFDTRAQFSRNSFFGNKLPPAGVVELSSQAVPESVVHEMTHAADRQLTSQYYELLQKQRSSDLSPLEKQFISGYEKLVFKPGAAGVAGLPRVEMAQRLAPKWATKQAEYRASSTELPAWGMGSTVDPSASQEYSAPAHLDPTMATEFSILLDLANRVQKSRPVTDKR